MFFEVVYISKANENLDEKDIKSIQSISKNGNANKDIRGCLVFYNYEFVGILEGEEEEVINLFDRIKVDPKHTKVELLASEYKDQRHFEQWNMVYQADFGVGKIDMDIRLFKNNLISLAQLAEKPTYASQLFWYKVLNLIKGVQQI